jgi:FlaA1/EpsC-like NDP-sugar epimerase
VSCGLCERVHVPTRIVPGLLRVIDGSVTASTLRNINVADLLGVRGADGRSACGGIMGHKRSS